jgi:serine/threonine protein kinase
MSNNTRDSSRTSDSSYDVPVTRMIAGKYTIQQCMDTAERVVREKTSSYKQLDVDAENHIPKFQMNGTYILLQLYRFLSISKKRNEKQTGNFSLHIHNSIFLITYSIFIFPGKKELSMGRNLGRGAFCVVTEVTKIKLSNKSSSNGAPKETTIEKKMDYDERMILSVVQDRNFMEAHCLRGSKKDCRYAIKAVQSSCESDVQRFINGVVDLAVEARFLSVICHPNIIKMRAMSAASPFSTTQPFFLILDRLYDILGTRIMKWKREKHGGMRVLDCRVGLREQEFWMERVSVILDLGLALHYLHQNNIVYRDIKPDNIGFDVRGDVKIFDFGLSKELDPTLKDEDGLYHMTADTGSPRYMAPEIFRGERYNESVDVYSFSILMWQILKLQTPFEGYTMSILKKKVMDGGTRPKCDPKWSQQIRDLLQNGWGASKSRPRMEDVIEVLRSEINCCNMSKLGSINDLDASRKSDASLQAI